MHFGRSRALAFAFLATAGVVGGAAGWSLRDWAVARRQPSSRDPQATVAYLTKQLGLSTGQADSIRTVLERRRDEMDSIWYATRPHIDSLRQTMQSEIEEQLTPTQRHRFQELVAWHERQRIAADSASLAQWDSDRDGIPYWIDKCNDTPPGTLVDSNGCPVHASQRGIN